MVYAIALASVLLVWIFTLPILARWARTRDSVLRVNLLPVAAVFFALVALIEGWNVVHGDTGQSRWMELYIAVVSLLSLVSPLAGFVQLVLVIEEVLWADEMGGLIVGDGFGFAILSTALSLLGLAIPLGYNCRPLHASFKERALTLSLRRISRPT